MEADGNYIIEEGHGGIRWILEHVVNSLRSGYNAKIHWGARSIYRHDWLKIKPFLKEHNIKTVLEYGVGVPTGADPPNVHYGRVRLDPLRDPGFLRGTPAGLPPILDDEDDPHSHRNRKRKYK